MRNRPRKSVAADSRNRSSARTADKHGASHRGRVDSQKDLRRDVCRDDSVEPLDRRCKRHSSPASLTRTSGGWPGGGRSAGAAGRVVRGVRASREAGLPAVAAGAGGSPDVDPSRAVGARQVMQGIREVTDQAVRPHTRNLVKNPSTIGQNPGSDRKSRKTVNRPTNKCIRLERGH